MSAGFRKRLAAEVASDPNFNRFVAALEQGTDPVVPREVLADFFWAADGTLEDVLEEIFSVHPQTLSIAVLLEETHWAGTMQLAGLAVEIESEVEQLTAELSAVPASLSRWGAFMDRDEARPTATGRLSSAASRPTDRSHGRQPRRSSKRRFEHP
ncbi:MAG: hypothetical protein ACRDPM_04080 [Solirubrobacteraceae bacterium]